MAMFVSLTVATALGSWYLRVRIPDNQWRRSHEAGRESMSRGRFGEAERQFATAVAAARDLGEVEQPQCPQPGPNAHRTTSLVPAGWRHYKHR